MQARVGDRAVAASFLERCLKANTIGEGWGRGELQGVLYSHRANYLHSLGFLLPDVADISSRDTLLMVVPMFHVRPLNTRFARRASLNVSSQPCVGLARYPAVFQTSSEQSSDAGSQVSNHVVRRRVWLHGVRDSANWSLLSEAMHVNTHESLGREPAT